MAGLHKNAPLWRSSQGCIVTASRSLWGEVCHLSHRFRHSSSCRTPHTSVCLKHGQSPHTSATVEFLFVFLSIKLQDTSSRQSCPLRRSWRHPTGPTSNQRGYSSTTNSSRVRVPPKTLPTRSRALSPPGVEKKTFATVNPATEKTICQVHEATERDVDVAVSTARKAFEGPWKKVTPEQRGKYLVKLADLIERDQAQLAAVEAMDNGKSMGMARADMGYSASTFR